MKTSNPIFEFAPVVELPPNSCRTLREIDEGRAEAARQPWAAGLSAPAFGRVWSRVFDYLMFCETADAADALAEHLRAARPDDLILNLN